MAPLAVGTQWVIELEDRIGSKLTLRLAPGGRAEALALKMAILHRKNSLTYKILRGARVGDIHMSLIHTCELNGVNPFDYLMALQQHAEAVAKDSTGWLPWNYRQAIDAANSG